MIKLITALPEIKNKRAEYIKIKNTFDTYSDIALFWSQEDKIYISMLDGNMVILNLGGDLDELSAFLKVISPKSVFTDSETAEKLGFKGINAEAGFLEDNEEAEPLSDELSSKEIYNIFKSSGLPVPSYEPFAVDICLKLNRGTANFFGIKNTAVAVGLKADNLVLINGIASLKKGMGSAVLRGLMSKNKGKTAVACFEEKVRGFYIKNNFTIKYSVTYWEKK